MTAVPAAPVPTPNIADHVEVYRLPSGRLVIRTPWSPDLPAQMRSMRAHRARLVPADPTGIVPAEAEGLLPDGRMVLRTLVDDRSAGRDCEFAWTLASTRQPDMFALLLKVFPAGGVAMAVGALNAVEGVDAEATSDGRVSVRTPWAAGVPPALKAAGGRWNPAAKTWVLPGTPRTAALADVLAAHLAQHRTNAEAADRNRRDVRLPDRTRRNQRPSSCWRCGQGVPPQAGGLWRCAGQGHPAEGRWGQYHCEEDRTHVECAGCLWAAVYRCTDRDLALAWAATGLPSDRVRLLIAAGVTPDETSLHDSDELQLRVLAGLLRGGAAA